MLTARFLQDVVDVVRESGDIIRRQWEKTHAVRHKGSIDLVTETDVAVEAFLKERLGELLPQAEFLAEESCVAGQEPSPLCWIIDPVDGTTNFVHRIPQVGTSVALWADGHVVLGVVNVPMMDECFWAGLGMGAFRNGEPIHVSTAGALSDAVVATGFPYAIAERLDDVLARLALVLPKAQGVRRIGAASVDLAYVAAGRQDAFYEMLLKPWDVAAGWLLVEEAGGRVTALDGRPYTFGDEIMASNGLVHKELRHLLAAVTPVQAERRPRMSLPAGDTVPRRLTVGDAAAMQALEAACFSLPWSEEQCRAAFSQQAFVAYGLEEAGILQGYISLYQAADELEVLNLAVLPAARRQGLGERLLRTALQEAEKTGINRALLEVRTGNAPAIALYEKCGFVRVGKRPRYYADTGEDALIYQCDLAPQD